ncbi:MAG: DUF721 domain-containing protein [Deltaproteobacteria bacterium]|nr:DUF721 domain-containing protein [Deltaproteobacteria bacterium]MBW2051343.1 DUF721 domain-containing protein [Deltaproteobacteria bacterium]MBW2139710.1 DUF721 domain-containing protein [Deltaproteobacteria bacterium]MBW2321951.1 DUF721 domain-containing protein [Deltaproteobacteria bacterium]
MPRRPSNDLTSIGKIISSSLKNGFLGLAQEVGKVFEIWPGAVGPLVAAHSQPDSIQDGRLTVLVESSVWIDRLNYSKAEFIEKINNAAGAPLVQEIIFKVGSVSPDFSKPGSED